jgi:hypothetical protein
MGRWQIGKMMAFNGKRKDSEKNLLHCHRACNKYHLVRQPGSHQWETNV